MRQQLTRADRDLTASLQGRPAWLRPVMLFASNVGHPVVITPLAFVLSLASYRSGNLRLSYTLLLACAAVLANGLLKFALRRARPDTYYAKKMWPKTYSFPSGHAFTAFVLFGIAAYIAYIYLPPDWNLPVAIGLALFGPLVGVSRVYLGAHYVLDVLGGWLLGAVALAFLINIISS